MEDTNNMTGAPLTRRVKGMGRLIHGVAWTILFVLPLFFTGGRETEAITLESYLRAMIVPLSFMLVFYVDYLWLVGKYLYSRHTGRFLLSNLALIVLTIFFVHLLMQLCFPHPPGPPRPPRPFSETIGFFTINAIIYMLVAGLSVAIKMTDGWYRVETVQRELEKERAEAELQNLRSQLNPHFLFNTLNNIYSLIAFSPEQAQEAVHGLSRLLRYVLYESSQPFVPLEKELDFLRDYVELMRIRLPRHVEVRINIPPLPAGTMIAPLLFISLVENAFKHGTSPGKPSFVHIDIHREGDSLICEITNSYFPKDAEKDKSGSGIGLRNLEKRLALLYPGRHRFIRGKEGDTYRAYLSITLNEKSL